MGLSDYIDNLDTKNEFQFFNFQDLSNMNKVFDYYKKYAEKILNFNNSEGNIYNKKVNKVFEWNYAWDFSINAGSREEFYKEQLQLNEGTICRIYAFFYQWVNQSCVFENGEEIVEEIHMNLTEHFMEEKFSETISMSTSLRKNNIAEYLAKFAIEIIVAHEIGHLYNGHTEYYLTLQQELNSGISEKRREQCLLDLRTLEYDADAYAVNRVLEEVVYLIECQDKILNLMESEKAVLDWLMYAIHGLCFLMRIEETERIDQNAKLDHPHPIIREICMISALKQHFKKMKEIKNIRYEYDFEKSIVIQKAESTMCAIKHRDSGELKEIFQNKFEILQNGCSELDLNWKRVAKYIKASSRLPIEGIDYN